MTTIVLPGLHEKQREVHDSDARFRVLAAGRRWGKTRLGVSECIEEGLRGETRSWWVAPTYQVARVGWRDLEMAARQIPGTQVWRADQRVVFPSGGEVGVRSADSRTGLRGEGLDFLVMDEAAFIEEDHWTQELRPALTDRQGRSLFISTPNGINNWFRRLFDSEETTSFQFPTSTNPYIDPAELEEARRLLGSRTYAQEYEAQFIEAGGAVFRREWLHYFTESTMELFDDDGDKTGEEIIYIVDDDVIRHDDLEKALFVDTALSQKETADFTVITSAYILSATGDRGAKMLVTDIDRRRLEAPEIIRAIAASLERNRCDVVYIEDAGMGLGIIQLAKRQGLPVRPLKADRDKRTRAIPLAARMEAKEVFFRQGASWLPEMEVELLGFTGTPTDEHDDQVDTLAYAAAKMTQRKRWTAS